MATPRIILMASAFALCAASATAGDMNHQMHAQDDAGTHHVRHGDLVLAAAFARATLPNQPVAGGYLTIKNEGTEDDVLVGVSASFAGRGEIHEMKMVDDTMKMRKLEDGLPIPAGETVTLGPGGYHLMFMQIERPLIEGDTFEASLVFEKAGVLSVTFEVHGKGAMKHNHSHGS